MARNRKPSGSSNGRMIWILIVCMAMAVVAYGVWGFSAGKTNARPSISVTQTVTEKVKAVVLGEEQDTIRASQGEQAQHPIVKTAKQLKEVVMPSDATPRPVGDGRAKMAIVLDDFGYNNHVVKEYNAMPIPLTYAVLPFEQFSTTVAESGHAAGKEIIVHLPMESKSNVTPEAITLRTSMSNAELAERAERALSSVPYAQGMNNHQGSKATEDRRVVEQVMKILANKGFFILDSRTSAASVIPSVAREYGVPYTVNELFLDNSSDVDAIKEQLRKAARMALRDGSVVVIGHDRPHTARAIQEMIAPLEQEGITFVFVSSLLQ